MIKLITLVKRKKTLSYQEFDDYWRNHHAALVNSQKEALGILHYVQSVPLQDKNPGNAMRNSRGAPIFDFDGMAEIYWQSKKNVKYQNFTWSQKSHPIIIRWWKSVCRSLSIANLVCNRTNDYLNAHALL